MNKRSLFASIALLSAVTAMASLDPASPAWADNQSKQAIVANKNHAPIQLERCPPLKPGPFGSPADASPENRSSKDSQHVQTRVAQHQVNGDGNGPYTITCCPGAQPSGHSNTFGGSQNTSGGAGDKKQPKC